MDNNQHTGQIAPYHQDRRKMQRVTQQANLSKFPETSFLQWASRSPDDDNVVMTMPDDTSILRGTTKKSNEGRRLVILHNSIKEIRMYDFEYQAV
jgi:hypothetical protein